MRTALIFAMLVAWAAPAGAQERLADQLRKGVVEEEVNQNTGKAIQAYQAIVARYDEDRKAAGTALYRLAECYRRTGKREQAIAAYQRVTREFADQVAIADPSRQQLAALGVAEPREVRPSRASTTGARVPRETRPALTPKQRPPQAEDTTARPEPTPKQRAPQAEDTTEVAKLEIQMEDTERRLAEAEKLIQRGLLAPADYDRLKTEYAGLQLRYEQQLEQSRAKAREVPPEAARGESLADAKIRQADIELRRRRLQVAERRLAEAQKNVTESQAFVDKLASAKDRPANYEAIMADLRQARAELEQARVDHQAAVLAYEQQLLEARQARERAQEALVLNERMMKSVEDEIKLVQQRIKSIEQNVHIGKVSELDPELLQLRRDLLGLQRKLDELRLQHQSIR